MTSFPTIEPAALDALDDFARVERWTGTIMRLTGTRRVVAEEALAILGEMAEVDGRPEAMARMVRALIVKLQLGAPLDDAVQSVRWSHHEGARWRRAQGRAR